MNKYYFIQVKNIFLWCLALGFFIAPLSAAAFFTDTETSPEQRFTASELQLDTSLLQANIALGVNQPAASTSLLIHTSAFSVPAAFDVAVVGVSGALDFCDNLQLQAQSGSVNTQSVLPAFTTLEQTTFGAYELTFSLDDPAVVTAEQECVVTLAVSAWQQNMNKATGYQDTIEYQLTITAADLSALRQADPAEAAGEVAGASVSSPNDPAAPTEDAATLVKDGSAPQDPPTPAPKVPAADAVVPPSPPAASGADDTTSPAPVQPVDEPEPKPKLDPEPESPKPPVEPVSEAAVDVTPEPAEEPAAKPEEDQTLAVESLLEEVVELEPGPKKENTQPPESQSVVEPNKELGSEPVVKAQTVAESPPTSVTKIKTVTEKEPAPEPE